MQHGNDTGISEIFKSFSMQDSNNFLDKLLSAFLRFPFLMRKRLEFSFLAYYIKYR